MPLHGVGRPGQSPGAVREHGRRGRSIQCLILPPPENFPLSCSGMPAPPSPAGTEGAKAGGITAQGKLWEALNPSRECTPVPSLPFPLTRAIPEGQMFVCPLLTAWLQRWFPVKAN